MLKYRIVSYTDIGGSTVLPPVRLKRTAILKPGKPGRIEPVNLCVGEDERTDNQSLTSDYRSVTGSLVLT